MGRAQRSRKTRAHAAAAHSTAQKKQQQAAEPTAIGAAAVAAAFADADAAEELVPLDNEDSGDEGDVAGGAALSRGQRKRLKRRSAFMKKMGLVRRVAQEKQQASKQQVDGAFADIAELQASLFQADKDAAAKLHQASNKAADGGKKRRMSGKQRQKLAVRELGQLRAVQTHPSFQGDPFAAIQLHLQNTVVKANEAAMAATAPSKAKSKGMEVE